MQLSMFDLGCEQFKITKPNLEKVAKNQSNASLYHLAGDSIVVDVLIAIFKKML